MAEHFAEKEESARCRTECPACRVERACILVSADRDLVGAVWLLGLPRGGETRAAIRAAERNWPVRISVPPSSDGDTIDARVRRAEAANAPTAARRALVRRWSHPSPTRRRPAERKERSV